MLKRIVAGKAVSAQLVLQVCRILQQFQLMVMFLSDGTGAYATWVSILAACGLFLFWDLGFQAAINFRVIKLIAASRQKSVSFWIAGCMWVHRRVAAVALMMIPLAVLQPGWFAGPLKLSDTEVQASAALVVSFVLTPFQNFLGAMYAAESRSHRGILLVVCQVLVQSVLLLGIGAFHSGDKLVLAAFSMLAGTLVSVTIGALDLQERLRMLPAVRLSQWLRALRPMRRPAAAYFMNPFLAQLVAFLQIKIVESFFGKGEILAAFGICRTIAGMPRQFASQFAAAQTAANIRSLFGEPLRFNRFVQNLGRNTGLGLGLVLGCIPFMTDMAAMIFPAKVPSSTREVIDIFCWAYALGSVYTVVQVVIPAVGRPHIQTGSSVLHLALLVLILAWPTAQPSVVWVVASCLAAEVLAGWFATGSLYRQMMLLQPYRRMAEGVLLAVAALLLARWLTSATLVPLASQIRSGLSSLVHS